MSTISTAGSNQNIFSKILYVILLFVLIGVSIIYFTAGATFSTIKTPEYTLIKDEEFATLTANQIRIIEIVSGHAWKHGTQVNYAIDCLENKGSSRSYKTTGILNKNNSLIPTNLWLCFDGKDWYAIVTTYFEKIGGNKVARLVTAYLIDKNIFPSIEDYIAYVTLKWGATLIDYTIEAGNIILQPK